MTALWLAGLLRRRGLQLLAATAGIAVAVALLGSIGTFLATSRATMTARAVSGIAVDWQVQVTQGTDPASVLSMVRSSAGTETAVPVGFARTSGLTVTTGGGAGPTSTQTTGAGEVLGLPADYRETFPATTRMLAGRADGVLLAQQTAANLHAVPGDQVLVGRDGLPPVAVTIDGIVALPSADALFQHVGAPVGAQPAAPPDNVLLLPTPLWQSLSAPLAGLHPDQVGTQVHVRRSHQLPPDPAAAYVQETGAARNLEARGAGGVVVGDNLAVTLDRARSDAAYAQVLFLFLGVPGVVLAGLLTAAIASTAAERRRREQALLRVRGADLSTLVRLAAAEALAVGLSASAIGLGAAATIGEVGFGNASFGPDLPTVATWIAAGVVVGVAVAVGSILVPAWRDARSVSVTTGRATTSRKRLPWWTHTGVGLVLLGAAGVMFWISTRNGYQLVLAPEGTPGISVSYWAFAGPALLWLGSALLARRAFIQLLARGRHTIAAGLRPLSGTLAPTVAAIASRRRLVLTRSMVLLGLALAFAISTAVFDSTYRAQAEVDAQLTNGADVTVTRSPGGPSTPAAPIAEIPGVRAVEPIQHRFAYVGADLQDLYGVNPTTITSATAVTDQYFQGGTARELLSRLAAAPDSILVSAETVTDFQLNPGDALNLRLPDQRPGASPGAQVTVPFHYAGIVTEFPTAPKDSFLVANAGYVAATTGGAADALLIDTGGQHTSATADQVRALVGSSAQVTDIAATRAQVGSSLAAVDLAGLTRIELGFALVIAVAASSLVFAIGLGERRRGRAIASLLGARAGHLRQLAAGEAVLLALGGLVAGTALGWCLAEMLVAVLSGVFDPPPDRLTVPWAYLATAGLLTLGALAVTTVLAGRPPGRDALAVLRDL